MRTQIFIMISLSEESPFITHNYATFYLLRKSFSPIPQIVLDAIPIDYKNQDFVKEIHRLTSDRVDVVFDPIGRAHRWRSRKALRTGGKVA
jgi:hypothetical protein